MAKLTEDFRENLRLLAFHLVNGGLADQDYREWLTESSFVESIFALWANVVEVDERGNIVNAGHAQRRVEQYVQSWLDPGFVVEPPFEAWETELF